MKFYKRFIGDIQKKTGNLSLAEFGAYDRLLDHYYATETPLPLEAMECYRVARAMDRTEREAVDRVLREFFQRTERGYVHERADEAMAEALPKIKANRENGKKGGRPRKNPPTTEEKPNGFSVETQTKPNENLSQSQSYSVPYGTGSEDAAGGEPAGLFDPAEAASPAQPPTPAPQPPSDRDRIFAEGVPLLTAAGVSEKNARSMLASLGNRCGDANVVAAITRCAIERPVQPVSWLQAALKSAPAGTTSRNNPPTNKHAGAAAAIFDGAEHV